MRIRIGIATCLVFLALASMIPASGQGTFMGVCTFNATFSFNAPLTLNSPQRTWSATGSGTCVSDAEPLSPVKTLSMSASGVSQLSQCAALRLLGSYTLAMFPSPAPPASSGDADFIGTAAGGVLHLSSSGPMFQGVGAVASGGVLACVNGGTSQLAFVGSLSFVDP
jgi:hypothetical protein